MKLEINQLNLESIVEVFQDTKVEKINEYLQLGWTLLNLHTTDYGHPVERHQSTVFTMGWKKEQGEVRHPRSEYNMLTEKFTKKSL